MSADRWAGARRAALATLACLALLGSTLPAPARVLADSPPGLHQTSCTAGPVPCQAQRQTNSAGDPGVWDCFPDSVYMALYGMQAEGILPSPLNLSWDRVRSEMRKEEPDPGQPVGQYVALSLVQSLTSNGAAADVVQTTDADWKSFLADQLAAGYPVAAQMMSWVLPGTSYHANHSIVVTGIDDAGVYYIDPWDGAAHSMAVSDFGTAWSSGWYAVTFGTQPLGADVPAAPAAQALLPGQTVIVGWQGNGAQYQAEIWNEAQTKWNVSDWISQTSWDSELKPDSTLLWRVRARSAAGVIGPWSLAGPVEAVTASPAPAESGSAPASMPPTPTPAPTPPPISGPLSGPVTG
jgi:hypothetical protein